MELDRGMVQHKGNLRKKKEISMAIFVSQSLIDKLVLELVFKQLGLKINLLVLDSAEGAVCETLLIYHASIRMNFCGIVFFDADCFQNDKNKLGNAIDLYLRSLN